MQNIIEMRTHTISKVQIQKCEGSIDIVNDDVEVKMLQQDAFGLRRICNDTYRYSVTDTYMNEKIKKQIKQ